MAVLEMGSNYVAVVKKQQPGSKYQGCKQVLVF
jgi:hypothetical protein